MMNIVKLKLFEMFSHETTNKVWFVSYYTITFSPASDQSDKI